MKIEQRKAKCPICGATNNDVYRNERGVKHHITNMAKQEHWLKEFNKNIKTPHLDYFRKQIKDKNIKIIYQIRITQPLIK